MVREEPKTETGSPADEQRRNFLKGAAATGVAALGLGAFSGGAAAQSVKNLNIGDVSVVKIDGVEVLEIEIRNINVLRDIKDNTTKVTIIGGDVFDLVDASIVFEEEVVQVDVGNVNVSANVLNQSLNNNDVLVGVAVLSNQDNVLASGDTIA